MSDRGRDTSRELTEIRTVLGRAETALATLRNLKTAQTTWGSVKTDQGYYISAEVPYAPDPDIDSMIDILTVLTKDLARWRKTGKAKKNVNLPDWAK